VKKLFIALAALAVFALPAMADTITFTAPVTGANTSTSTNNPNNASYQGGAKQFTLDHHDAYTWQINNILIPQGQQITGATITFTDMRNWDTNPNMLFVHLLDTAVHNGNNAVGSYQDVSSAQAPVTSISDAFAGSDLASNPLVAPGVGNTFLFQHSFSGTSASSFTFTFTSAQLQALMAYINNGNNIAFGFDPDCHFFNNGITFTIFTNHPTATPEPMTLTLLGTGLAGLYYQRRRRQQQRS
jgi:PEP-CTERM motif